MQFLLVYIREAHASDGTWPMKDGPVIQDPTTLPERSAVARTCVADLGLGDIPALVDDLDDAVNLAYEAWPDRLYLVSRDGRIAYKGARGPAGFKPGELEEALEHEFRSPR